MVAAVRRWAVPVTESEARVLTSACLAASALSAFCSLVPFSPTAPTRFSALLAVVAAALGGTLWASRRRLAQGVVHAVIGLVVVLVSGCVALSTTPVGAAVTAFGFVWIAIFVAWFHPGVATRLHTAAIGVGLLVGLACSDAPALVQTWVFVMATVAGVAGTLDVLVRRLRRAADHDQLTGLLNRSAFLAAARRTLRQPPARRGPVSVAVLDLDDFKLVNDRDGHAAGDRLLVDLATSWQATVRRTDVLARYGGDEFVLLMPDTTATDAAELLYRLGAANTASRWTAGVAQWAGEPLEEWIARADADLYRRKARQRGLGDAGAGRSVLHRAPAPESVASRTA
ncbi:GGDEF domain-containing protein [Nocardioides panacis]|uniref:GGDEF domain-containing protein n=1 Tax=Nocardioides panacis TaxID=2849501 RepID=A0A975SXY8_9ACTN|nr:GGDEF domain-containing protein [Nocardioides panacis]QWZ07931.1 GGDEF domain-containing protein [Nocardioides panacis]